MSNPEPVYSLIIPAYNEETELPLTLRQVHLAMSDPRLPPGELIVVDNNSSDRTGSIAQSMGARTVFEPVNQIARARNAGARVARGEFLVFLDADTRIPQGILNQALESLQRDWAGGGARLVFDAELPPSMRRLHRFWDFISVRNHWAAGSFLFARRSLFETVGGFNEKVYAGEEVFLSRALRRIGRRQGLLFAILRNPPVVTSARKFQWYSPMQTLVYVAFLSLFPFALRSRRLCAYWYRRPTGTPK